MAAYTDNLLVRLINHRVSDARSRREDYLTECFAWLLENDPGFQQALLGADGPFGQAGLQAGLQSGHLAGGGSRLSVVTQEPLSSRGRPDLRLSRGDSVLFVECKVDAPYDPKQISGYLGHASGLPRASSLPSYRRPTTAPRRAATTSRNAESRLVVIKRKWYLLRLYGRLGNHGISQPGRAIQGHRGV